MENFLKKIKEQRRNWLSVFLLTVIIATGVAYWIDFGIAISKLGIETNGNSISTVAKFVALRVYWAEFSWYVWLPLLAFISMIWEIFVVKPDNQKLILRRNWLNIFLLIVMIIIGVVYWIDFGIAISKLGIETNGNAIDVSDGVVFLKHKWANFSWYVWLPLLAIISMIWEIFVVKPTKVKPTTNSD